MSCFYQRSTYHPRTVEMTVSRARCTNCRGYFKKETAFWFNNMHRICSEQCFNEWRASKTKKKKEALKPFKAWEPKITIETRAFIHERDGSLCRACGKRGTQCHHIQFRSQQGTDTPDNLILLCQKCHMDKAHGVESRRYRELFRAYVWLRMVEGQALFIPEVARRVERRLAS